MTDSASTMGSSRTAAVLDPVFLDGLSELATDEVRSRRDESLAEREFLSYLRRLLQVRQDVLAAEQIRRGSGEEPEPLVDRLTAVLSKGSRPNGTRGEAIRTLLSEADIEEAERQADAMITGVNLADVDALGREELERAVGALATAERAVSSRRAAVMRVHDRLQEELKRRYRDDPTEIPTSV
jgi:hypothetical protein